jgi:hypothetical protein
MVQLPAHRVVRALTAVKQNEARRE